MLPVKRARANLCLHNLEVRVPFPEQGRFCLSLRLRNTVHSVARHYVNVRSDRKRTGTRRNPTTAVMVTQ